MNSTANDPQKLSRKELSESIDLRRLEKRLDIRQQEEDVEGIRRLSRLAVKYMGKQNGFQVQNTEYLLQNMYSKKYSNAEKNTIAGGHPVESYKRSGAILQRRGRNLHSFGHNAGSRDV